MMGANQIVFDPTVFSTHQTIALSGKEIELKDTGGTQTIIGPAAGVTISGAGTSPGFGGGSSRVFEVDAGVTASISGLTISGGSTYTYPGIAYGGGLLNFGGTVTLSGCTLSGNYAYGGAGGLVNAAGGTVTLTECTLSGNSSISGAGGLISRNGTATLTDCTLSGNDGGTAGGLEIFGGTVTLTECTVSGNSCNRTGPGGVFNYSGTATLAGCTISGNYGGNYGYGGLVNSASYNLPVSPAALIDTIVAGNSNSDGASDIAGADISGYNNLIGTGGSGGLANGVDGNIVLTSLTNLGLAPLGNNGGPTQTMALLTGSAAIGAGVIADSPATTTPITTDQRGLPLDSPNPDIGAFQIQVFTPRTLTFSGISNQSMTYGTASVTISGTLADGSQAPVGETVAVTLDGDEQSATVGSGGGFSATFNDDDLTVTNSPYTVKYAYTSDGTFASASTTSTLTVNPATLTITAAPDTKVYSTADPALAYTASGFQFDDTAATVLTGALARAEAGTLAGEQAGEYAITQGTLAADSNYTINFTGSELMITPAPLTITANLRTKVYGTVDPTLTDNAAGFIDNTVDGVTIDDTAATVLTGVLARAQSGTLAGEQVGDYAITQGTLAANSNYTIAFTGSTLTITPATFTVTANAQTKVYGTGDPPLTVTTAGLIDTTVDGVAIDDTAGSVLTGALARAEAGTLAGEQAGEYAITQGTLAADSNYKMTFTGNALTITPAPLTITANSRTKVYGTADPTLADTPTGLIDTTVDGVTIHDTAAMALSGGLVRVQSGTLAGEQVGDYAITQGTLAATNYTISFMGSTLTITPAPLTVTGRPETKVYGTADPGLAYTATGFLDTTVDGVAIDDIAASALTGHLTRAAGETVSAGPYAINQGTLAAGNYAISFTGSTLTITPATLTVTANAADQGLRHQRPDFDRHDGRTR